MAERITKTINFYKLESAVDTFYLDLGIKNQYNDNGYLKDGE